MTSSSLTPPSSFHPSLPFPCPGELSVSVGFNEGADDRVFAPPWTAAKRASDAVMAAAVEAFCDGGGAGGGGGGDGDGDGGGGGGGDEGGKGVDACTRQVSEVTYKRALLRSGSAVGGGAAGNGGGVNGAGLGGVGGGGGASQPPYTSMPVIPIVVVD